MSIQSISFWQQDQNYWNQSLARDQSLANSDALISVIGSAMTNLSSGLSSIANQTALTRTNTALTAALQSALQSASGGSAASSTGTSTGSSSTAAGASSGSASSGSSASNSATSGIPLDSASALQTGGTAEILLAGGGASGTLVNLLA